MNWHTLLDLFIFSQFYLLRFLFRPIEKASSGKKNAAKEPVESDEKNILNKKIKPRRVIVKDVHRKRAVKGVLSGFSAQTYKLM